MSLDQILGDAARGLAAELVPPEVDLGALHRGARARRRRTQAAVMAAVALAAVTTGALLVDGRPDSTPQPVVPVPTPTSTPTSAPTPTDVEPAWSPDSVSARDVVQDARARATATGVAAGDPDTRLAIWSAAGRTAVAVTTDGYRTTSYASVPRLREGAYQVLSPRDDLFLLSDVNQTEQWLVGADGSVREVDRVRRAVLPEDERLWFQCADGGWRSTWCALDPEAAKAYVWPEVWDGSAVPPGTGVTPWGANPEPRSVGATGRLEVWWGTGGERQVRTLAVAQYGDYVLDCPSDVMALWSVASPGGAVSIHSSTDAGATWQVTTYAAPTADQWWKVRCAADGAFIAVDSERGTVVWRAARTDSAFRQVLAAPGSTASIGGADVRTVDGLVLASGEGVAAISEDAGSTWTRLEDWR
jgi:hypothetical protein